MIKIWLLEKTLPSPQPFLMPSWPLCSSGYRSADSPWGWPWRRTQRPVCLCSWNGGSGAESTWRRLSHRRWRQQWGGKGLLMSFRWVHPQNGDKDKQLGDQDDQVRKEDIEANQKKWNHLTSAAVWAWESQERSNITEKVINHPGSAERETKRIPSVHRGH